MPAFLLEHAETYRLHVNYIFKASPKRPNYLFKTIFAPFIGYIVRRQSKHSEAEREKYHPVKQDFIIWRSNGIIGF